MSNSAIVGDFRVLKALERRGFVRLMGTAKSRTRHWSGLPCRVITVECGPKLSNWYQPFEYNGHTYRVRYIDGCFHPFVCDEGKTLPAFV